MNNLQRHSILFDAPVGNNPIYLGQGNMIENINVIYNPKIIRAFLQSYMVVLIFQYIACFSSAPFDNVENRPSISVLSSIYSLFMVCSNLNFEFLASTDFLTFINQFCICACLLPFASLTIPNIASYKYLIISAILQFVGCILSLVSAIKCLSIGRMYLYDYDSTVGTTVKTDVTTYIQIMACISLTISSLGLFLSLLNTVLASNSLKNLNNKINRRTLGKHVRTMNDDLPRNLVTEQIKSYMP